MVNENVPLYYKSNVLYILFLFYSKINKSQKMNKLNLKFLISSNSFNDFK